MGTNLHGLAALRIGRWRPWGAVVARSLIWVTPLRNRPQAWYCHFSRTDPSTLSVEKVRKRYGKGTEKVQFSDRGIGLGGGRVRRGGGGVGVRGVQGWDGLGVGEGWGEGLFADLGAEGAGVGEEVFGGQVDEFAPGEDGFDFIELVGEAGEFEVIGGQDFFVQLLEESAVEIGDVVLVAVLPGDKGGSADLEFLADEFQAAALGAQFDESVFGFEVVHGGS